MDDDSYPGSFKDGSSGWSDSMVQTEISQRWIPTKGWILLTLVIL